jgi:hypothetical protein
MESSSGFSGMLGADGAVQRSKATTPPRLARRPRRKVSLFADQTGSPNRRNWLGCLFEASVRSGLINRYPMGPNPLTTACHGPQEPSGSRDLAADLGADAWLSTAADWGRLFRAVPASPVACPAFFRPPAPADVWPRRADGGPGGAPRDRCSSAIAAPPRLLHGAGNAIAGRTTWTDGGPTLGSRGAEKAGRSRIVREADTAHVRARAARIRSTTLLPFPSSPCSLGRAGAWWARRGRAAASGGMRATRAPRYSAARTAAQRPPAGAA